MKLGYRIIRPSDVGSQPLPLAQISLWRRAGWGVSEGERAVAEAIEMAQECRARGISSVFHPLDYPLTGDLAAGTVAVMKRLAAAADLGIIIHDEGAMGRQRLSGDDAGQYERIVREISERCPVSIENSYNSGDITWFWQRFVVPAPPRVSITLDIGHLELAGLDSGAFVHAMKEELLDRITFVHMHHHDARTGDAVPDHKPLVPGCREIDALRSLAARKNDLYAILELDAVKEGMEQSIALLKPLLEGAS